MSHRIINGLSSTEANFGTRQSNDYGGWALNSGTAALKFIANRGYYNKYVPGDEYESTYMGNSLQIKSTTSQASVVAESPFVDSVGSRIYLISVAVASNISSEATLSVDYYMSASDSSPTASSESKTISIEADKYARLYLGFAADPDATLMKVKITFTGPSAGSLASDDIITLYDPVVCEDHYTGYGRISYLFYTDLPEFMRLDDENIASLVKSPQVPVPLKRFVESLAYSADNIADTAISFQYTRATEGTESKSKLTDPDTADAAYLFWLASITATTLLSSSSGFTPWTALEDYDGDSDTNPGEWEDFETLADWIALQSLNPDFFDTVQGFRDQIRTGFSGINAGRADTIVSYIRTLLDTATPNDTAVVVNKNAMENPFQLSVLVDPTVDPDSAGNFITDAVNSSLSAGAFATKVSKAANSGDVSYDMTSLLYPATHSNSAAGGVSIYGKSFISDERNFARHIRLNETSSNTVLEIGGGVGDSHYSADSQYFYGDMSSSTYGSITSSDTATLDLGGSSAGYDLVFVLTDITLPSAAVDTAGDGGTTPADWLYREKYLLACGTDSSSSDNDWAVYLVSGHTSGPDTDVRLLLVDGYEAVGASNYAVSDPIDFNSIGATGQYVLRVSRSALSASDATVSFYAQSSLYDDWNSNAVGSSTFTPGSASAGADAGIQILGQLNATDDWADATPVSCGVKRVLVFDAPISFTGSSNTSSSAHAYVGGDDVDDFGMYVYSPTLDIDLSAVAVYADSFTVNDSGGASVTLTVNQASSNDLDVLAMRQLSGADVWYFGAAASGGDSLSINNLSGSTAYRVIPTVVDPSDGSTSTADFTDFTTDVSGVLTITAQDDYDGASALYQGITVTQIDVQPSGGGSSVATFLPGTIASTATTGADSVTPGNTWTLTRSYPGSSSTAYAPSQVVDRDILHVYEGSPSMHNPPPIESYHPFSVLLQVRRFWTSGTYDIFRLENATNQGLRVFYDDGAIKATFTDNTNTETVTWTESPSFGDWHWLVVRRDPANGLELIVNGTSQSTATAAVVSTFTTATNSATFGQGAASEFNARFGLAEFAFFDRRLSDIEITLLGTEIS
jgi:hypothetical protein